MEAAKAAKLQNCYMCNNVLQEFRVHIILHSLHQRYTVCTNWHPQCIPNFDIFTE